MQACGWNRGSSLLIPCSLDPVGFQGQGRGVGLGREQLYGTWRQSLRRQQGGAASGLTCRVWQGAQVVDLQLWTSCDSATCPSCHSPWAASPWVIDSDFLSEASGSLCSSFWARPHTKQSLQLPISGGGEASQKTPGARWRMGQVSVRRGAAGGERSWEGQAEASDLRTDLALNFLCKQEFFFSWLSPPNLVFSSVSPWKFLQVLSAGYNENESSNDPTHLEGFSLYSAFSHLFKENWHYFFISFAAGIVCPGGRSWSGK